MGGKPNQKITESKRLHYQLYLESKGDGGHQIWMGELEGWRHSLGEIIQGSGVGKGHGVGDDL
jgi:hypothetical protein